MSHDPPLHTDLDHDDPEPGLTWFIGLAGAIILTALVLAISVLYFGVMTRQEDKVVFNRPSAPLEALRHEQREKLVEFAQYSVTDADGKVETHLRIPIRDAMSLIVKEGTLAPQSSPGRARSGSAGST